MTTDETQTTGTPEPDDGDAGETSQTTGTQAGDGRNAGDKPGINTEEALVWKAKAERLNEVEAENDRLRKEREQPPGAPAPQPGVFVDWNRVLQHAQEGDEVAKAQLVVRQALLIKEQQEQDREALDDVLDGIDDPADRKTVRKMYKENRDKYHGDPNLAREDLRTQRLEKELADTRTKLKQHEDKSSPRDAVRLPQREQPASEIKARQMTQEQWDRDQAALDASDDPKDHKEKMRLQMARRRGEITVKR